MSFFMVILVSDICSNVRTSGVAQHGACFLPIDLMHDDVTRPKGSMVDVVKHKPKMAAGSPKSGEIVKVRDL